MLLLLLMRLSLPLQHAAKQAKDAARLREELQQAVIDAGDLQEMLRAADDRHSADAVRGSDSRLPACNVLCCGMPLRRTSCQVAAVLTVCLSYLPMCRNTTCRCTWYRHENLDSTLR